MKHFKLLLLTLVSLLGLGTAHADTQSPYLYDFNTAIDVSNHSFAPFGWGHIVDKMENSVGTVYMTYTYLSSGGVDNSGCLKIGDQTVNDYMYNSKTLNDMLVLPPTSGEVSIYVKADATGTASTIKFYYVDYVNGEFICNVDEDAIDMNAFTLSQEGFTKIVLPELPAGTLIGVRGNLVTIDNVEAESAEIVAYPKLALTKATSTMPTYVDADADGNYTVSYDVVVENQGQRDLVANETGFSLTLVNQDKKKSVITVPITENLAMGERKTISVSGTLTYSQYPDEATYIIRENINNSTITGSKVKPYPYNAVAKLYKNGKAQEGTFNFGTVQGTKTQSFTLSNDGASPLVISEIQMPEGFTTSVAPQTVAGHGSIDFPITFTATASGEKSGNMVIKSNASDYTLTLKAVAVDESHFFATFEENKVPAGMVSEEGWIISTFPSTAGIEGNKYCAETQSTDPVKLITPLMNITAGEPIYFDAGRRSSTSFLNVYYSSDRKNWTLAHTINADGTNENTTFSPELLISTSSTSGAFRNYKVNIPAGQYYVAFEAGNARVDNILGHAVADVAHDISFTASNMPIMASVNHAYTASATFRNNNTKAEAAGSYQVNFYFDGTKVGSAESVDFAGGTTKEFTLNYTPHAAGTGSFYALYEADGNILAYSDTINLTIQAETAYSNVQVGVANDFGHNSIPLYLYYQNSESDVIYTASQLGFPAGTKINKLVYKGWNTTKDLTTNLKVYITNTTDNKFTAPYSKRDVTTMTKVYDGTYVFPKAGTKDNTADMLVVLFNEPFEYTGDNLSIVMEHSSASYANVRFESNSSVSGQAIRRSDDNAVILTTKDFSSDQLPVVTMSIETSPQQFTGVVTELATGNAIANAQVVLNSGDVQYSATTNESGAYSMDIYQSDKEYTMIVKAGGYMPHKQQVSDFSQPVNVALDVAKGFFIEKEDIPATGMVNYQYTATATAMNTMSAAFAAGSYTAKLYMNGEAVAEAEAVAIEAGASADYRFTFTPHADGTFPAYIEFVAGTDVAMSQTVDVVISPESLGGIVQVLDSTQITSYAVPVYTYDKNSESQTIYTAEQLGIPAGAVIKSIKYRGYNNDGKTYDAALRVYMENTEDSYENGFASRDSLQMTRIFCDTVEISNRGTKTNPVDYLELPIEGGFRYTGQNLRVAFHIEASKYSKTYFVTDKNVKNTYRRSNDNLATMEAASWSLVDQSPVMWMEVEISSKISGEIVTSNLQPVSGATVMLKNGDVIYQTKTEADGTYEMTVAQIGLEYQATVAAEGYKTNTHTVTFANGDVVLNDTLTKPYYLTGYVKANTGNAIVTLDGATITVVKDAKSETAMSEADGAYEVVVGDAQGEYTVITSKDGYVSDTTTVTFTDETVHYDATLLKINTISGAVYGADEANGNTLLAGATVTITKDGTTYTTTTDENGNYSVDIPAGDGTYTITVTMTGYNPGTGSVTLSGDDATADDIVLTPILNVIDGITTENGRSAGDVYTAGGQYVGRDLDMNSLPKGIYIINGKKVVIK